MWKWEYNIFILSGDCEIKGSCEKLSGLVVIGIVEEDICLLTSRDHMIRVSCDFLGGFLLTEVAALISLVAVGFSKEEIFRFQFVTSPQVNT